MLRLGWFSSGRDEAARNILSTVIRKKEEGVLDASVAFVFCNWDEDEEPQHPDYVERKKFFELVHGHGIPLITLSWKRFRAEMKGGTKDEWRAAYGEKMRTLICGNPFELGVLAGYALGMDSDTCTRFDLLNLHPALPGGPSGSKQEVIHRIIATGSDRHGAMMHLRKPDREEGPALTFCSFSLSTPEYKKLWQEQDAKIGKLSVDLLPKDEIEAGPLFKRMRADGEKRELPLVTFTIKLFADGSVTVRNGKLYEEGRPLSGPYDLTLAVDEAIARGEF
jgi:phosphoribosylglycinamide formyltransferase-1